jgi:hypothetical protein
MTVHQLDEGIYVNVLSVTEPRKGSVKLGEIEVTRVIGEMGSENVNYDPPDLAMGSFPEAGHLLLAGQHCGDCHSSQGVDRRL